MSLQDLEAAQQQLQKTLLRYQALNVLAKTDENFAKPGIADVKFTSSAEVKTYVKMAECQRLIATFSEEETLRQAKLRECVAILDVALECVHALRDAKLEGLVQLQYARTYASGKNYQAAKKYFAESMTTAKATNNTQLGMTAKVELQKLELAHNKVAYLLRKMKKLAASGNKEEEQVRAIFDKYDHDGKGYITAIELRNLATDLGTHPELTDDELKEALRQIDQSDDDELSFEELWSWWILDKL